MKIRNNKIFITLNVEYNFGQSPFLQTFIREQLFDE